ncbi:SOS response-associated peptidase [Chondromyces apiculatus]|uniref:Abasic site processing protein n=1 Tax=Chondromyces apiculatus DSM 436 TaxID=1192034 RepID=A0A017T3Q7_9BACT|nr:SOS response-associated peptidase [Chondromyces apiculatus]EYF03607.1 Hypothetical protein CAP_5398 [Chondromyces apiculatus DSM 436]
MCARYTLTIPNFAAIAQALLVSVDPDLAGGYRPGFNIAPGTTQLILRGLGEDGTDSGDDAPGPGRALDTAVWGLVNRWVKDPTQAMKHVNARSEGVREKPSFRQAFARRRCVIPADGFYEWTGPKGARQPVWFHPREGGLLKLAGLYESFLEPATGENVQTFTVLTTAANDVVARLHDRMPVLLADEDVDAWLGLDEGVSLDAVEALMRPAPNDLLLTRRVSRRVNGSFANDPTLLDEEVEVVAERPAEKEGSGTVEGAPRPRRKRGKEGSDNAQLSLLPLGDAKPGRR